MSRWSRATVPLQCGYCWADIPVGAPVLTLHPHGDGRRVEKRRCAKVECAGESVPATLPPYLVARPALSAWTPPSERPMTRLGLVRPRAEELPMDYKLAASGDRDPGEEG